MKWDFMIYPKITIIFKVFFAYLLLHVKETCEIKKKKFLSILQLSRKEGIVANFLFIE